MKVLVACEESQTVCKAFRDAGHEAYSCDIQECSGGHPEWHIVGDAVDVAYGSEWDLIIAHPPCTYITNSGVRHLYTKNGNRNADRWFRLKDSCSFFKKFLDHPCPRIAIENPIPHKYAVELIGRKYDQLVQPWMFGHMEQKATCFWLKGLPKLDQENNVKEEMMKLPKSERQRIHYLSPGPERAKLRSKTFEGLAQAMVNQWGEVKEELTLFPKHL